MIEEFERHLRGTNLSENTISSYLFALRQYNSQYDGITKKNLRAYKVWLIESYKPKTVNLRLRAINCYLESIGKENLKMPFVRVQQKACSSRLCRTGSSFSKPASNGMVNCSGTLLYVFWQRPAHESANSYRSRWNTSSLDIWIYIRRVVNFGEYIYQSPCKMKPFLG